MSIVTRLKTVKSCCRPNIGTQYQHSSKDILPNANKSSPVRELLWTFVHHFSLIYSGSFVLTVFAKLVFWLYGIVTTCLLGSSPEVHFWQSFFLQSCAYILHKRSPAFPQRNPNILWVSIDVKKIIKNAHLVFRALFISFQDVSRFGHL